MLVSVIIPCYNVEGYVAECLESVLNQEYRPIEIIAIDNNSTDHTWNILQEYENKYQELIQIEREYQQGASAARNLGLKMAKGAWIQFLDADDLLLPQKIKQQVKMVSDQFSFLIGTPWYMDLEGQKNQVNPDPDPFKGVCHGMHSGNTCANLWNRKLLDKVNGWDERLPDTQDTDLMFRLLMQNDQVVIDPIPATICRSRPKGQVTQIDRPGILDRHLQLRKKMINYLESQRPDYFKKNRSYFYHAIYRLIRMLAKEDLEKALLHYADLLKEKIDLRPMKNMNIPLWNVLLVRTLGFSNTEKLITLGRKYL